MNTASSPAADTSHPAGPESEITERLGPGTSTWADHSAFHIARYQFAASHVRGRRVLDAGTGLGYGAAILKAAGAASVTGIDIDAGSIAQARARFAAEGLEYLEDDCEVLANVRGPFDVLCNFENIEHLRRPEAFLARAADLLADDGVMFCSTPERATSTWEADRPENPYHVTEWYRHEFRELLSRAFEDVEMLVQVEGLALLRRREAVANLNTHLSYLWGTAPVRLARLMGRVLGRAPAWPSIEGLAAASPADYPIVPELLSEILGGDQAHSNAGAALTFNVAICRRPRR